MPISATVWYAYFTTLPSTFRFAYYSAGKQALTFSKCPASNEAFATAVSVSIGTAARISELYTYNSIYNKTFATAKSDSKPPTD